MKIAIHKSTRKGYFSDRWISYCKENQIPFKEVNCYDSDIVQQLSDCDALMWHFSHADIKDFLFAKQLIKSLEGKGLITLPNYSSCWHFDDKVAQKYLFDSQQIPSPKSFVFFEREKAYEWAKTTSYPKVFKLRSGASASNVYLANNISEARALIKKAFGKGFRQFNRKTGVYDAFKHFLKGSGYFKELGKSLGKLVIHSTYERYKGKERGYVYFQDFIPNNKFDTRIIVIGSKAYGMNRQVRPMDFRASGSGRFIYEPEQINKDAVRLAFKVSKELNFNVMSYDFIFKNETPLIIEISYGFATKGSSKSLGYWDENLNWHSGKIAAEDWMVETVLKQLAELK